MIGHIDFKELKDLKIDGIDGFLGESGEAQRKILDDPTAPLGQRRSLAKGALHNFNADALSESAQEAIRHFTKFSNAQEVLFENKVRRNRWAWCFKAARWQGGKNAMVRRTTEIVLENTFSELCRHAGRPDWLRIDPQVFQETIATTHIDPFVRNALPTARRAVPLLAFNLLFPVIPVSQPGVKQPFLKRKYAETVAGGATSGNEVHPYQGADFDPYFAGGRITNYAIGTGNGSAVNFDLPRAKTYNHIVYKDGVATTAFTIGAGAGTGGRDRIVFTVAPANDVAITATFDTQNEGQAAREMRFDIELIDVPDDVLMLQMRWNLLAEQNAGAFYGVNFNTEAPTMLSEEIYQMLEAIVMPEALSQAGAGDSVFDAADFLEDDTTTVSRKAYEKRIYETLIDGAQDLYALHRRWPTWVMCGRDLATRLYKMEGFNTVQQGGNPSTMQMQQRTELGYLANNWAIYQNNKIPAHRGFMGWEVSSPFYVGYILTMFLPFYITPDIWKDTINFERGRGAMMRCGHKMIDPSQYATVTVQNG